MSIDELDNSKAVGTEKIIFNQTMMRIKDPKMSLNFKPLKCIYRFLFFRILYT